MSLYYKILKKYLKQPKNKKVKYAIYNSQVLRWLTVLDINNKANSYMSYCLDDNDTSCNDSNIFEFGDVEISKEDFLAILNEENNQLASEFFKEYL